MQLGARRFRIEDRVSLLPSLTKHEEFAHKLSIRTKNSLRHYIIIAFADVHLLGMG